MLQMKTFCFALFATASISLIGCSVAEEPGPVSVSAPSSDEVPQETALGASTFARIAVIGASGGAGFNLQLETGVPTRLADFIGEALLVPHAIAFDGASELMFVDPEAMGAQAALEAAAVQPTLVIAPDFLFWFFYGRSASEAARHERLEGGLALLEPFTCSLVIGEIPFMASAAGGMIPHSSMPDEASFDPANARIHAWAAERDHVSIVPLVSLNKKLKAGGIYRSGESVWDTSELGSLLQDDGLHPNMGGMAILATEVLSALAKQKGATLEGVTLFDLEQLVDRVDDLVSSR